MRLHRPYIPLSVRVMVAERQCEERGFILSCSHNWHVTVSDGERLRMLLKALFGDAKVELHHRPALCNRQWFYSTESADGRQKAKPIFCDPDANDPDYLVYLPKDEHDIETRVRGQHGDYSDLAKARKRKRKERKAEQPKRKWPSRPFPKVIDTRWRVK